MAPDVGARCFELSASDGEDQYLRQCLGDMFLKKWGFPVRHGGYPKLAGWMMNIS